MEFFTFASGAQNVLIYGNFTVNEILMYALIFGGLCFALVYSFGACALYTIARRGGYKNKWMAFVPVLNTYYVGVLSEKNRIFNIPAKIVSLITAVVEALYIVLYILYYVAMFSLASGGYLGISYETVSRWGATVDVPVGFAIAASVPASLGWTSALAGVISNFSLFVDLVYIIFNLMLLIVFFQTYAPRHYVLYSVLALIFPVKGILFFAVRNNTGKNYRDYIREIQEKRYAMYRQYQANQSYNPYNYNPYSGRTQTPPSGDPYNYASGAGSPASAPEDPFGEFGSSDGQPSGKDGNGNTSDPFGDL